MRDFLKRLIDFFRHFDEVDLAFQEDEDRIKHS